MNNIKVGDIISLKYDNIVGIVNKISIIWGKELYHYESVNSKGNMVYGACEFDDIKYDSRMYNALDAREYALKIMKAKGYEK